MEIQAHNSPVLFVRAIVTSDELDKVDTLRQILLQKFGPQAKLLVIVPCQLQGLGPHLIDGMPNVMVYLTTMANYAEGVSAALKWISGQLPNSKRSKSPTSIEGLYPVNTGFFGIGGLPAFENTPDHVPRPPVTATNIRPNHQRPIQSNMQFPGFAGEHQSCGSVAAPTVVQSKQSPRNVATPAPKASYPNADSHPMSREYAAPEDEEEEEDDDEYIRDEEDTDEEKPKRKGSRRKRGRKGLKSFCGVPVFESTATPLKGPMSKTMTAAGAGGFLALMNTLLEGCSQEGVSEDDEE
jgi:hypothetical protein